MTYEFLAVPRPHSIHEYVYILKNYIFTHHVLNIHHYL